MIIYTFNFWLPSNYFFLHFRFFFGGVPAETFWLCRATRQWRQQLRSMEKDVVVIIAHTLRWIRDEKFFWLLLEWRREDDSQGLSPLFFFQVDGLFEVFILLVATDMSPNENKRKPLIRSRAWIQTLFVFSNRKRDGITGRCTLVACVWFVSFLWFPSTKIYCCVRKKKKNNWLWSNDVFWGLFSFFFFSFLMLWLFLVDRRANHCRQRQRNCR